LLRSNRMLVKTTKTVGFPQACCALRVMVTTVLFCCCLLVGCSNDVRRNISKEFADNSGRFDGVWKADMMETASPQVVQRWRINCQSFEQSIPINVSAGRVETRINDTLYSAYISNSGRFRLSLTDGRVTLILQGDLLREPRQGSFTFGIAEFANAGCSTRVSYKRVDETF